MVTVFRKDGDARTAGKAVNIPPVAENFNALAGNDSSVVAKLKGLPVECIEEFEELAPEVYKAVYANGTALTVNFGGEKIDDMKPLSCRIGGRTR